MPSVPYGWYAVLRSRELRPGRVVSLHYFGRALTAFRGADGQAAVRDAHCPHYGAHLAPAARSSTELLNALSTDGVFDAGRVSWWCASRARSCR
jgi:nitrite reductase/ring-hydroxylating ferredoxin subunit